MKTTTNRPKARTGREPARIEVHRALTAVNTAIEAFNDELDTQPNDAPMHPEDAGTYGTAIAGLVHMAAALMIRSASEDVWLKLRDELRFNLAAHKAGSLSHADALKAATRMINEALDSAIEGSGLEEVPKGSRRPYRIN